MGKATNIIPGNTHKVISWFFSRNSAVQKGVTWYIKSDKREEITTKNTVPSKALSQIWWRNQKKLTGKQKLRELSTTRPASQQMLKETL